MDRSLDDGRISICWESSRPILNLPKVVEYWLPPENCKTCTYTSPSKPTSLTKINDQTFFCCAQFDLGCPLLLSANDPSSNYVLMLLDVLDYCKEHVLHVPLAYRRHVPQSVT